jgi:lipopolysaccharide export system ATP-binding protein
MTILESKGLFKYYRKRAVVADVSIRVVPGEVVGLLGPNGAGKTTTFYMIIGFIRPDSGAVYLGDKNLSRLPMYRRAALGIGYLAQEASVFRKLSVEDNIMAILQFRHLKRRDRIKRLEELLKELDIGHLRKAKAYTLSGGERRRVEITRALVTEPKFILLD